MKSSEVKEGQACTVKQITLTCDVCKKETTNKCDKCGELEGEQLFCGINQLKGKHYCLPCATYRDYDEIEDNTEELGVCFICDNYDIFK